ncbi:MAG: hypothetical protein GYA21_16150 [Myxococcales bacterium]|nr:hypothetical protein [Myxococcales bacterium]
MSLYRLTEDIDFEYLLERDAARPDRTSGEIVAYLLRLFHKLEKAAEAVGDELRKLEKLDSFSVAWIQIHGAMADIRRAIRQIEDGVKTVSQKCRNGGTA